MRMGEWMCRSTYSWPWHYLEVSGQLHAHAALPTGKKAPSNYWVGGWVDPSAGLHDVEKRKFLTLPGLELRLLGRPARSLSLYRLLFSVSQKIPRCRESQGSLPCSHQSIHTLTPYFCKVRLLVLQDRTVWCNGNTLNLYSNGAGFEHRLFWVFSCYSSVPRGKYKRSTTVKPWPPLSKSFSVILPFDCG
jgi:hypothetical protein